MEFTSATVDHALNSLASCIRCRERRVGCDRMLPSCQACAAIGAECELYDHVLEAKFPRSYLLALQQRLRHLEALAATVEPPPRRHSSVSSIGHVRRGSGYQASPRTASERSSSLSVPDSFPQSMPTGPTSISAPAKPIDGSLGEWGPSSAFAHLRVVSRLLNIELNRPLHHGVNFSNVSLSQPPSLITEPANLNASQSTLPPIETSRFLLEFYHHSVDAIMPIFGRKLGDQDLELLYKDHCTRNTLRACTRMLLALAMASRMLMRSSATKGSRSQSLVYLQLSDRMFEAAASSFKAAFSDSPDLLDVVSSSGFENEEAHSMAKLQIVLLLASYVLSAPRKGNVWQLLGFAERLWRSIQNARQQLRRSNSPEGFFVREQALRPYPNLLYCSFVSLERMLGPAFGRPIDFLEYSEADEPTHMPDDRSVPAMYAAIQEIKERIHCAHLSAHQDQRNAGISNPRKVLSAQQRAAQDWGANPLLLHQNVSPGSHEWYEDIKHQTDAWFERWVDAIDTPPPDAPSPGLFHPPPSHLFSTLDDHDPEPDPSVCGSREWLLTSGQKWRDETLHLAFGLLVQHTTGVNLSPTPAFPPPPKPNLLPPPLVAEGRALVARLVRSYAYLLRQPFRVAHTGAGTAIPLVFPRVWTLDLDIFRVAVSAAYLSRHPDPGPGPAGGEEAEGSGGGGAWRSWAWSERERERRKSTQWGGGSGSGSGEARGKEKEEKARGKGGAGGGEGRKVDMAWEIAMCVKLLATTTSEVDTEGLTEAILALVGDGG